MKIVVTGARGFIGSGLVRALSLKGHSVVALTRAKPFEQIENVTFQCAELSSTLLAGEIFSGAEIVIHLAASAHNRSQSSDLVKLRVINRDASIRVAELAIKAGVRHFIFMSSIGVHGNSTTMVLREGSEHNPVRAYALSKLEAENELNKLSNGTGMGLTVLRAPLIYGPGAPGSIRRLLELVKSERPLPFGGMRNRRNLLSIDNVNSLLVKILEARHLHSGTFLVCDDDIVSTTEIIESMASGLGVRTRLFYINSSIARAAGSLPLVGRVFEQLFGSLEIDNQLVKRTFSWAPDTQTLDGIERMARSFSQSPWP